MRKDDGEIREFDRIPKEELGAWSKPFHVGQEVDFLGVTMEIVKIKKARKEIILRHSGGSKK